MKKIFIGICLLSLSLPVFAGNGEGGTYLRTDSGNSKVETPSDIGTPTGGPSDCGDGGGSNT